MVKIVWAAKVRHLRPHLSISSPKERRGPAIGLLSTPVINHFDDGTWLSTILFLMCKHLKRGSILSHRFFSFGEGDRG
jgi:hypothetical protein